MELTPQIGLPYPLGATLRDGGTNFTLWSDHATKVELCFYDAQDPKIETDRIELVERTEHVFHAFVPGIGAGQLYGYRVHGLYDPSVGAHFNPAKLMVDPYAKGIAGEVEWCDELLPYLPLPETAEPDDFPTEPDLRDNAHAVPKSLVVDDRAFDWGGDRLLRTPWTETVIYEMHVKGFTKLCAQIPEHERGSYAGVGSPAAIEYFQKLGVTAVELLPIHYFVSEPMLAEKGLSNYWGYNTLGFFAPAGKYSSTGTTGGQIAEFKQMVKNLHAAGLEVILDVVYNHTCEGGPLGQTFCFRGIDNQSFYRSHPDNPAFYFDYTGCGNTPDMTHPRVLQLVLDSLRYWVEEMHIDGFRFDLASALTREEHLPDMKGSFLKAVHQDPVLSRVKLIAEPWDIGEGGYLVGNFPIHWSEWNGKYRDTIRHFWKSDAGLLPDVAYKLSGSPEYYEISGRRPYASINFLTAHDGFTLTDLISYNEKHNEANGEDNRDGDNNNASWNCGAEGTTEDAKVLALRARQRRNFLVTLFLSQGVPMLVAGDEFGRTQQGNNNIYCQDNELGWLTWERDAEAQGILDFTSRLIRLRREHPVFRHPKFLNGQLIEGVGLKDVTWFHPAGKEMTEADWHNAELRSIGLMLCGDAPALRDDQGQPFHDSTFLLLINAGHQPQEFLLGSPYMGKWMPILDTAKEPAFVEHGKVKKVGSKVTLADHSMQLLELQHIASKA
ncbi:MAG: glycogen debranching protein GlgX [Chthoniobacterales bacterium]